MPEQPNSTFFFAPTYRAALGDTGWRYSVRFDARYKDKTWLSGDSFNMAYMPAVTTYNGSLTFSNEAWRVQLWGRNLSNEDQPQRLEWNNDNNLGVSGGSRRNFRWMPRSPREVGINVDYNF